MNGFGLGADCVAAISGLATIRPEQPTGSAFQLELCFPCSDDSLWEGSSKFGVVLKEKDIQGRSTTCRRSLVDREVQNNGPHAESWQSGFVPQADRR